MMSPMTDRIEMHTSVVGYFEALLREALEAERVTLEGDGVAYLLQLITDLSAPGGLLAGTRGEPGTPGLVWLYQAAREAPPTQRFDAYRRLGDVALVVSGFFAPHIERASSLVGVDYYVNMGSAAYHQAAASARTGFSELLRTLAAKFGTLVEVLTRVAEQTTLPVNRDLATLFERVARNPDCGAGDRLLDKGLFPVFAKGVAA